MIFVISMLVFIAAFLLMILFLNILFSEKVAVYGRLSKIKKTNSIETHDELSLPLFNRVIKPLINEINKFISKIMPSEIREKIEKKIEQAGNPFGFNVNRWIIFQMILIAGLPLFTLIVAITAGSPLKNLVVVLIIEMVLGFIMPRFILSKKITERQEEIIKNLPDVLDLLTVSVEAGLGFDAALLRVVDKVPGELTNEFAKAIHEMKVGTSRKEALKNLSDRVGVQDVTTFVGSIIQADQLGVSIGNVLRIQSGQMRQKRRQRAQEKAMKAPVKMLFPMVFFIFPTIFAVLLGPVVIMLVNNFVK